MTADPRVDANAAPVIVATGPLTSDPLSADIARLVGADHLYFYDAISPIVLAETIDHIESVPAVALGRSLRSSRPELEPGAIDRSTERPT